MELAEYEAIVPNAQCEGLTWLLPNQHCAWRVSTLLTKEPDTIAWIQKMGSGDVLYDIGANMGQYSMLAAKRGVRVHAFEPEAQNFALLVRNIAMNNLSGLITPWPVALSNQSGFEQLHLSTLIAGGSCHSYGDSRDFKGEPKKFPFVQGSCATTLDQFCRHHDCPTFIKIDVDGFEHKVIEGGYETLKRAKSVLIEINTNYPAHMDFILPRMANLGFEYDSAQAESSRRKEGPFTGVGNIIWYRDGA